MLLGRIAVLTLLLGLLYWLFTRSGWQLTRTAAVPATPPVLTETEVKQ